MKIRIRTVFILLSLLQTGNAQSVSLADSIGMHLLAGMWYEVALHPASLRDGCHCTTIEFEYFAGIAHFKQTIRCIQFKNQNTRIKESDLKLIAISKSGNALLRSGFLTHHWYRIVFITADNTIAVLANDKKDQIFVLSRDSFVPAHKYSQILKMLDTEGYKTSRLQKTSQNCDIIE